MAEEGSGRGLGAPHRLSQGDIPPEHAAEEEMGTQRDVPERWSAVKCSHS